MFEKILIANRGEIAVRIIRACREMGIQTVAVCSEVDKDALHAQLADECVCIGSYKSKDSYLNIEKILSAAIATKADAIHPGFGFLSENSKFAKICNECNIEFIGPSVESMINMGNKSIARQTMIKAGVPVVPGTNEPLTDAYQGKKKKVANLNEQVVRLKKQKKKGIKSAQKKIKRSITFRVGKAVLYIPRKLKCLLKRILK